MAEAYDTLHPEIGHAASVLHQWMEKTFPTRRDELERVNVKKFGAEVHEYVTSQAENEHRKIDLLFNLEEAELLIPSHVLHAVMEGLVRNAIEAVPDGGTVDVSGHVSGDRYILKVKDTGVGIPEKDRELMIKLEKIYNGK